MTHSFRTATLSQSRHDGTRNAGKCINITATNPAATLPRRECHPTAKREKNGRYFNKFIYWNFYSVTALSPPDKPLLAHILFWRLVYLLTRAVSESLLINAVFLYLYLLRLVVKPLCPITSFQWIYSFWKLIW